MKPRTQKFVSIFGVKFLLDPYPAAKNLLEQGTFMVVPSGPGLSTIYKDKLYHQAIQNADFAIPDSGLLVLLLKYLKNIPVKKLSGLGFLRQFLMEDELKNSRCLFLVDPNASEMKLNHVFLQSQGVLIDESDHYVAPIYKPVSVEDQNLLILLEKRKPKYILINIGGGIQEKLGYYLKKNLSYKVGIICTGAAIAFLTQKQASIPSLFDALHLGWLLRCIYDPRRFVPRYVKSLYLIHLVLRDIVRYKSK
jgi:UDP-N-acetyl-D-mannosaminuronic acid transferase (WecB/TagA/CpsF family)